VTDEDAVSQAGGYLRNAIRGGRYTCARCAIPADRYEYCLACQRSSARADLADAVAILTYAVAGQRSGELLHGYKAAEPDAEYQVVVRHLVRAALSLHAGCPGQLAGSAVTHWAAVPSLPRKQGEHALHEIVKRVAPGCEVVLVAAQKVRRSRAICADHFEAETALPAGGHVLLFDDTWTTGGHAQSAALALKKAGAERVSLLVVARWIKPDFFDNEWFLRKIATKPYDPAICPWTGGQCPPSPCGH
jgi:hypothetical protein